MRKTIVAYGEALWDLLPSGPLLGGAPLNFAYRVQALGNPVYMVSRLGEDDLGEKACSRMKTLKMDTSYIQRDSDHRTGTVDVFFDEKKNPDYTINPDTAYDHIRYTEELATLVSKADCLCFGSLIQREAESRQTLYSLLDDFQGTYALFDINLRKNCYSKETLSRSLEYANVLKLNEDEITELDGMFSLGKTTIAERAKSIVNRFRLSCCLVTLGENGSYAVSEEGVEIYGPGYQIELVDPIGSGDACTAGFIHKLLEETPLEEAVDFGNAFGACVASTEGASAVVTKEQVEAFTRSGRRTKIHPEFA